MKTSALLLGLFCAAQACDKNEAPKQGPTTTGAPVGASTVTSVTTSPKEVPATTTSKEALAAYRRGEDAMDNMRYEAAREQFKKALSLDPTFISASAMLGATTPGPEGDKMLADAIAKSTSLPEAEQVAIKVARAAHEHDMPKAAELAAKLTELVPGAWHAHLVRGRVLHASGNLDAAMVSLKKAIEIEPTAAAAYNELGYVELAQGKTEEAITRLRKYAELRPDEPNPQDSLAEALLAAGKTGEAEAAFRKALEIDPKFVSAWDGLGYAKLYKGDFPGAYVAFRKQRDEAPTLADKESAYRGIAFGQLAQGKPAEALKTIDAWQAEADKAKNDEIGLHSSLYRLAVLIDAGKTAEALALVPKVLEKNDQSAAPEATKSRRRGFVLGAEALANARLGKKAEAEKAATTLTELFGASEDMKMKGLAAFAQGQAALAKGDPKAAVEAFKSCAPKDEYCAWERSKAEEKAGDRAAATASREKLAKTQHRDPFSFYVWSRVQPKK
jgi:tetratricopeptide (TPR) repeat protein